MASRLSLILLACLVLGSPVLSGVDVTYDPDVDFSFYGTYAWSKGVPAANEWVEEYIVKIVEGYLEASGLRKVDGGQADLEVTSTVVTQAVSSYSTVFTRGTLVVNLVDTDSNRSVWQAAGKAQIDEGDWAQRAPEHIKKKIDKVTRKMFRDFPPF